MKTISRHAGVTAVLNDPSYTVPIEGDGAAGGLGWLRATVPRFSNGATHGRRRALAVEELARIDPEALRRRAYDRTAGVLQTTDEPDVAQVARAVPVGLLAEALGARTAAVDSTAVVDSVVEVARVYVPPPPGTPAPDSTAADAAVDRLVRAFGGHADETAAARICLLVQACETTAGLIVNAVHAGPGAGAPVEALLAETLRYHPPVRATRRDGGSPVRLDLAAANRDPAVFADPDRFDPGRPDAGRHLTFGAGPRSCPGRDQALALAAGVVEAVHDHRPATLPDRDAAR